MCDASEGPEALRLSQMFLMLLIIFFLFFFLKVFDHAHLSALSASISFVAALFHFFALYRL
jgi:hypothetical protein